MAPSRPNKDKEGIGSPIEVTTSGGGAASDRLYDIYQRISSIESSLTFIVASVDDSKGKIEVMTKDVIAAKSQFEALRPIATTISRGIWAIVLLLATFGLSVLGMWIKHHMGW